MTRPSIGPEFATAATYPLDGDPWQGLATRVDPGASRRAEGYEPALLPAQWLNHALGTLGDWAGYLRDERDRLNASLEPSGLQYFTIHASEFGDGAANTSNAVWSYDASVGAMVSTSAAQVWLAVSLDRFFPTGTTISEIRALVKPGGVDRIYMRTASHVLNFNAGTRTRTVDVAYSGASVNVASMRSDGTTATQAIGTGTLSSPLAVTRSIASRISAAQTNRTVEIQNTGTQIDTLYGLQVGVTLPIARNY